MSEAHGIEAARARLHSVPEDGTSGTPGGPRRDLPDPAPGRDGAPSHPLAGETPVQRHLSLLELIATQPTPSTLQRLTEQTGLPKPTVHRMLQQLEETGMILRDGDGRHFGTGPRLRRLAERTLLTDVQHGARHRILTDLVAQLGESCNITALAGDEVIFLDRVETPEPLRFTLAAGSRVPAHASASGKLLLSQLSPAQRERLLGTAPLARFTPKTITDPAAVQEEITRSARCGYAVDDEEFLPGLVCAAVLVPDATGSSSLAVAVQAPALRLSPQRCGDLVPALERAASAIARIDHAETP